MASDGLQGTALEIRSVRAGDGFSRAMEGGYFLDLELNKEDGVDKLARTWARMLRDRRERGGDPQPQAHPTELTAEGREAALADHLERTFCWTRVEVKAGEDKTRYQVALQATDINDVRGAHELSQFFGAKISKRSGESRNEIILQMQMMIANYIVGIVGLLVAVLVCAPFIPDMIRKGTLDLTLARPVSRVKILLFKYLGGLWFIAIVASFLIGGCWLAFTVRTGVSNLWLLGTIPVLLACFAVLNSIVTLLAVVTRSGAVSGLVALGVWMASGALAQIRLDLKHSGDYDEMASWARALFETVYNILPKTSDLVSLNTYILSNAHFSAATRERILKQVYSEVDWTFSAGTSVAFILVMLGWSCWLFRRRDY